MNQSIIVIISSINHHHQYDVRYLAEHHIIEVNIIVERKPLDFTTNYIT